MGRKHPDRWPAEVWRGTAETVGSMKVQGWSVRSYCRACHLMMEVDLDALVKLRGPGLVLWNRQAKCRRIGCAGVVEFQGRPPDLGHHMRLFAQWAQR